MDFRPLHEECGVFGVFDADKAAANVLVGLGALQHRGQEGCGVATLESSGRIAVRKGLGLVSHVFPMDAYRSMPVAAPSATSGTGPPAAENWTMSNPSSSTGATMISPSSTTETSSTPKN